MPKDGHAQVEDRFRSVGGALFIDTAGPAGQDERARPGGADRRDGRVEWDDLRIDTELADLPGDELGVLGPEIEDEDLLHG